MNILKISFFAVCLIGFTGGMNLLNADCNTGGPGASSCTDSGSFNVSLIHWSISFGYENSVTCQDGYYACCNSETAKCVESDNEDTPQGEDE